MATITLDQIDRSALWRFHEIAAATENEAILLWESYRMLPPEPPRTESSVIDRAYVMVPTLSEECLVVVCTKIVEAGGEPGLCIDPAAPSGRRHEGLMSPAQCREARWLLGMSRERLAAASGIAATTIAIFEKRGYVRRLYNGTPHQERFLPVRAALEAAGVEFTDGKLPIVQLRGRPL